MYTEFIQGSVLIKPRVHEKQTIIVMLSVLADGRKLTLLLL